MSPICVLVGPPGAGKSTIGPLVAAMLDVEFLDTDLVIEGISGKSVADIFIEDGEDAFRALERQAVGEALEEFGGVLALGGGAVMDSQTQLRLQRVHDRVIFLDVSLAAAGPRVGFSASRPLLVGNPRAQWQRLMDGRRKLYELVAATRIVTDELTPDEASMAIVNALEGANPTDEQ